jgi:transposase
MRPIGTADQLEARRLRAARLLRESKTLTEVAKIVKSSVSSVKRWKDALDQGGQAALKAKPHPGRQPRLSFPQKERLLRTLARGASKAGFATDLWTCPRVAEVIRRTFGVTYHVDYVGTLLHKLGWSPQKPEQRARERDDQAVAAWHREDWPRLKKEARAKS